MKETLTLSEASTATGKHRSTLIRGLQTGRFPNATKDGPNHAGVWRIPVADLKAAGYTVNAESAQEAPQESESVALQSIAGDLLPLIQEMTNAQREAAEAKAALEKERELHRYALERAKGRRAVEVPIGAAVALGVYAAGVYLEAFSDPSYLAAAIPAGAAIAVATYAGYLARKK
jgi:hypothetical protein